MYVQVGSGRGQDAGFGPNLTPLPPIGYNLTPPITKPYRRKGNTLNEYKYFFSLQALVKLGAKTDLANAVLGKFVTLFSKDFFLKNQCSKTKKLVLNNRY